MQGYIQLRIDKELKEKADKIAKSKDISLSEMIRRFLIKEVQK